ncbi:M20 family metallopeptidase [Bacillus sp. FJAT-45037]|uniref:M20 family metallopeptidase n=1 Tax=Bacillus sp. FJAT-45037 TaxID=2011007 RepID=UPI000C235683|nr:M20 family metallopeptidase [Bacillus sp. FJAT-45037]
MNKDALFEKVEAHKDQWINISRYIWENPELGHDEHKAMEALTNELRLHEFDVDTNICNLETAFIARFRSEKPGPTIGYFAEYDALPEIGHACGHNLIGMMSTGAAITLKEAVREFGGEVIVFGTPAEETNGAKVTFAEEGLLDSLDAALMAHPSGVHERSGTSMAMEAMQFDFYGQPAHAAASPDEGINALEGVIQTFNLINALRQHVPDDVRIHGIITNGGDVVNVVPARAQAQFYVRANTKAVLEETSDKVKRCVEAAALATGCEYKITNHELGYDNMTTNETLSELYCQNLIELGIAPEEIKTDRDHGSLDMGNVSQVIPAIHPYIKMDDCPHSGHTVGFRDASGDSRGFEAMILGIKTLAATGYDLLTNPTQIKNIREEFEKRVKTP